MSEQGQLFPRKWNVTVANAAGTGLDLTEFHIKFKVNQSDISVPNWCDIRIYNLSKTTATQLFGNEFDRVQISAGYRDGPYGVIFDGTIKQTRRGRENQIDTYVDILAAEGDEAYNYAVAHISLAKGATLKQQLNAIAQQMGLDIGYLSNTLAINTSAGARGQVKYGLGKNFLRQAALANNARWSIQNGKLFFISNSDYIEANPVLVSPANGLIGIPEQTQDGIKVRMLLNPKIGIGRALQINSDLINPGQTDPFATLNPPGKLDPTVPVNPITVGADNPDARILLTLNPFSGTGLYRVVVSEFVGDTRGNDWYSDLICFAINPSVNPGAAVNPWPGA